MSSSRSGGTRLLVAAAVGALITSCGGQTENHDTIATESSALSGERGLDYESGPSPQDIRANGYTFVARYLSYYAPKNISAGEVQALKAAGVDVVVVWEQDCCEALNGYGQGVSDAQAAESEANAAGMPPGRPIYFAIDFDAQAGQQGALDAYFDGVAAVLGRGRTGAYGGFWPISRLFNDGKITWAWQTYAWSGGNWDPRAQVRQVQNDIYVGGAQVDLDVSAADDFGQWNGGAQTVDQCSTSQAQACGNFGCGCQNNQCGGVFCPGVSCSATRDAQCGAFGCNCANGDCNGGFCPGDGCEVKEAQDCAQFGCGCVDHQCNGGFCQGTGCTARETLDCGNYGCGCVDHQCNGAYCPGSGCTALEMKNCGAYGCGCVDHQCNGGFCDGTGCTPREALDCGNYGCGCVDHKCNGGFCPGSGCTARETLDCGNYGCGCVDHKCNGSFCQGTGCTAHETLYCQGLDAGCSVHECVDASGKKTPIPGDVAFELPDGGAPATLPDGGSLPAGGTSAPGTSLPDGGWVPAVFGEAPQVVAPAQSDGASAPEARGRVRGVSCAAGGGSHAASFLFIALAGLLLRRRS